MTILSDEERKTTLGARFSTDRLLNRVTLEKAARTGASEPLRQREVCGKKLVRPAHRGKAMEGEWLTFSAVTAISPDYSPGLELQCSLASASEISGHRPRDHDGRDHDHARR
jgi:hypothetical protein